MRPRLRIAAVAIGFALAGLAEAAAAPFAAVSPAADRELRHRRPTIVFAGDLPDGIERDGLLVFIDADDVTEFAEWEGGKLEVTAPLPLQPGEHLAVVRRPPADGAGESREPLAALSFTIASPGALTRSSGRFTDSIELAYDSESEETTLSLRPHIDGAIEGGKTRLSYDVTAEHRFRSDGDDEDFEDPDAVLTLERAGLDARLGTLANVELAGGRGRDGLASSEFLGMTAYRRALDLQFGASSPVGRPFSLFSNVADSLPSVRGERSFEQRIGGGSWLLPLPGERVQVRLMSLEVEDRAGKDEPLTALSRPQRASLLGAMVGVRWSETWRTTLEVAASDREVEESGRRTSHRDEALRLEVDGKLRGHRVEARLARLGGRFGNPADPRLAGDREEGALTLSKRGKRWSYRLSWRSAEDGLEDGIESTEEERTGLSLSRRFSRFEAKAEWKRLTLESASASSEQIRRRLTLGFRGQHLRLDLEAGRTTDERTGYGLAGSDQDNLKLSWRWSRGKRWSLRGSLGGSERVQGQRERETTTFFLEPAWSSPSGHLRAALNLSLGDDTVRGLSDRMRRGARGSLDWRLGAAETWFLGFELAAEELENGITGVTTRNDRVVARMTYSPEWTWGLP